MKTIVIVFSILIIVEALFLHFLILRWSVVGAWILTILNIYALLYMIRLYHSVRLLPHIVYPDKLIIRFGFQSSIEIKSITAAKEQGGFEEEKRKDTYYAMLNIDSPQYEIFIKEPTLMKSSSGRKNMLIMLYFERMNR